MITEDYVSFEIAKLLKEKGFDEICRKFYKCWPTNPKLYCCDKSQMFDYCTNSSLSRFNYVGDEMNIAAPTHQMAIKWLREVHSISIDICTVQGREVSYMFNIWDFSNIQDNKFIGGTFDLREQLYDFKTYEEAVESAIKYCLENLI